MAKKCFMVSWNNCANVKGTTFLCADTVATFPKGCGVGLLVDGVDQGYSQKSMFFSVVASANPSFCPSGYPFYSGNCNLCEGIKPNQPYDCVNGGCVPKTTYNTPGKYANLAACEGGCAKDSTCKGECVSAAELTALQQAADKLQSRMCG